MKRWIDAVCHGGTRCGLMVQVLHGVLLSTSAVLQLLWKLTNQHYRTELVFYMSGAERQCKLDNTTSNNQFPIKSPVVAHNEQICIFFIVYIFVYSLILYFEKWYFLSSRCGRCSTPHTHSSHRFAETLMMLNSLISWSLSSQWVLSSDHHSDFDQTQFITYFNNFHVLINSEIWKAKTFECFLTQ